MDYGTNRPKQLEGIRADLQDKFLARNPQLAEKLIPLMNKANMIQNPNQDVTEPTQSILFGKGTNELLKTNLVNAEPISQTVDQRMQLRNNLNQFANSMSQQKSPNPNIKKISQIRPDILFGLS